MVKQQFKFARLNQQLNQMGAIAPDLQGLVFANPDLRERYYFRRDTHWTNIGAAHSADALAKKLGKPGFDAAALSVIEIVEEPGSLSAVVDRTCDKTLEPEQTYILDFPAPQDMGLLDIVPEGEAVLLGTSFSDRHRRDAYQVADALSAALETSVTNMSVTGGGMIGPFESYILTGRYAEERPKLIIWEFPYTYLVRAPALRQILGALRSRTAAATDTQTASIKDGIAELQMAPTDATLLSLTFESDEVLKVDLLITFANGTTEKLPLRRKKVMREIATFTTWWADLSRFHHGTVTQVQIEGLKDLKTVAVALHPQQ